jgi:hypothetical protein
MGAAFSCLSLASAAPVGEGVWPAWCLILSEGGGGVGRRRQGWDREAGCVGPASLVFEVELSTSSWQNHLPQFEWRPWPM